MELKGYFEVLLLTFITLIHLVKGKRGVRAWNIETESKLCENELLQNESET